MLTWNIHRAGHGALGIALAACAGAASLAEGAITRVTDKDGTKTKEFSWAVPMPGNQFETAAGSFEVGATAYAVCTHKEDSNKPDPFVGTWLLRNELKTQDTGEIKATATHATGKAKATAQANAAKLIDENKSIYQITGKISAFGESTADECDKPGRKPEGKSEAWSKLSYKKDTVSASRVTQAANKKGEGTSKESKRAKWDDPIMIRLTDEDSGDTWTEELFSMSIDASSEAGDFLWTWDDEGVRLSTPRGADGKVAGSIAVYGGTQSSWVENPVAPFHASLVDGVFTSAGSWASLGWVLSTDGNDVVSAFLPYSEFATTIDLAVAPPEDLIPADHKSSMEVSDEDHVLAVAENVPSPGAGCLAVTGLLSLGGLRRRR